MCELGVVFGFPRNVKHKDVGGLTYPAVIVKGNLYSFSVSSFFMHNAMTLYHQISNKLCLLARRLLQNPLKRKYDNKL